jgi:MoaA/NifB/PqqE/SkfB family radical SAM enzyme
MTGVSSCITYRLGRALYVALTNRCNAVTLVSSRGPGFILPAASGFSPLPDGFEPDPEQVAAAVQLFRSSERQDEGADTTTELCFAGAGEPLLRLSTLEQSATLISQQEPELPLRVNTNGLIPRSEQASVVARLHKCGIRKASVAIASADPAQYTALMKPEKLRHSPVFSLPLGLDDVTNFVSECRTAGLLVECTTVDRPDVDVATVEALAKRFGASSFRARSWHP